LPNFGQGWTYDVNITAPELTIKRLRCTPDPAVPGKRMLAKAEVAVTRAGTPEALPPTAHVGWRATVGSLTLKPLGTKTTGAALTATWKLPKAAKAKVVHITVTVTSEGVTVTKTRLQRIGRQRHPALTRATAGGQS